MISSKFHDRRCCTHPQFDMSTEPGTAPDPPHEGSCHCKAIRFTFEAPDRPTKITICNCSICNMKATPLSFKSLISGFQHFIVPKEKFNLTTSWENIRTYTFGTGIAKHYFCGTCGIAPFYVPRSNPNAYSVCSWLRRMLKLGEFQVCGSEWFRGY